MNSSMQHLSRPVLGLLVLLAVGLAACEFVQVDEGRDEPTAELIASVAEAQTQDDAEAALRQLLNKARIGTSWEQTDTPAPFSAYELSDEAFERLAGLQASHNRGELTDVPTLGNAYALMVSHSERAVQKAKESVFEHPAQPITATFENVLISLDWARQQALENPEAPGNAHVLAMVPLAPDAPLSAATTLSPVQRFLFGIWLHKYAPSMPLVFDEASPLDGSMAKLTGGNQDCPSGTFYLGKYEFDEKKWSSFGLDYPITGMSKSGGEVTAITYNADLSIAALVVKGGTASTVVWTDGEQTGTVNNTVLPRVGGGNYPALSNIKFCGGFQTCVDGADAMLAACLASGCIDEDTCLQKYVWLLNQCHNQGLVGTP